MDCQNCKLKLNCKNRKPLSIPCGHTICEECYDKIVQPQEQLLVCPFDQKKQNVQEKVINIYLMEHIKENKGILIYCKDHPKKEAEFYCLSDKNYFCSICSVKHFNHHETIIGCLYDTLEQYLKIISQSIEHIEEQIAGIKDFLQVFYKQEKCLSSDFVVDQILKAKNYLLLLTQNIQDKNNLQLIFENQEQQTIGQNEKEEEKKNNDEIQFIKDSVIVTEKEQRDLIKSWLKKGRDYKTTLLYKGTRDGFASSNFHTKCDNQQATLTIIKSSGGKIFGGVTNQSWNQGLNNYVADKQAFIYSLNNKAKLKAVTIENAIYCHGSYSATFGAHSIYVANSCNQNQTSYANYQPTYYQAEIGLNIENVNTFFAEARNFTVSEIEVFKLSII